MNGRIINRIFIAFLFFLNFPVLSGDGVNLVDHDRSEINKINWGQAESDRFYVLSAAHVSVFKPLPSMPQSLSYNYVYQYSGSGGSWKINIGNVSELHFFSMPDDKDIAPYPIAGLGTGEYATVTNSLGNSLIFTERDGHWLEFGKGNLSRVLEKSINEYGEQVWYLHNSKKEIYEFDVFGLQRSIAIGLDGVEGSKKYNYSYSERKLISIKDDGGEGYEITYNSQGKVSRVIDTVTNNSVVYYYDEFGRVSFSSLSIGSGDYAEEHYFYHGENDNSLLAGIASAGEKLIFESQINYSTGLIETRDVRYAPLSDIAYQKPVIELWSNEWGSIIDLADKSYYLVKSYKVYKVNLPVLLAEKALNGQNWFYLKKQILKNNTKLCSNCISLQELEWSSSGNLINRSKVYPDDKKVFERYYYNSAGEVAHSHKQIENGGNFVKSEYWSGKINKGKLLQEITPELTLYYNYDDSGKLIEMNSAQSSLFGSYSSGPAVKSDTLVSANANGHKLKDNSVDGNVTIQAIPVVVVGAVRTCAMSPACVATVTRTGQAVVDGVAITLVMLIEYWSRDGKSYEDCAEDCSRILDENPHPMPRCWSDTRTNRYNNCMRICEEGGSYWDFF